VWQVRSAAVDRFDSLLDGQVVFVGEGVVLFVVSRHAHHRTRAHVVKHVRGNVHRQFLAGVRVGCGEVRLDAAHSGVVRARHRLHVVGDIVVRLGQRPGEVVARRQRQICRAIYRVEPRRERLNGPVVVVTD